MKAETPSGIKDITKEWVEEMLTEVRSISVKLKTVDVHQATEKGDNFVSMLASVDAQTEEGEEIHIMVKLAPEVQESLKKQFFEEGLLFEKEAFAYKHLTKDLDEYQLEKFGKIKIALPVPKCLYIKKEEDGRAVIVMENLRKSGFQMFEKKKDTDYAHAVTAIRGLSKLHAISFAMKKEKGTDYASTYPWIRSSFMIEMTSMKEWFSTLFNPVVSILEGIPGKEEYSERVKAYQDSVDIRQRYEELSTPKEPMSLVTHGDFWNNNMMFKYSNDSPNPSDFRMLDLQICRYTLGVIDLLYYIYSSTTGIFREKYLTQLLKVYYDSFIGNLEILEVDFDSAEYSFNQLIKDFDDRVELGFITGAMLIPMAMSNKEEVPDMDNVKEEDTQEFLEDWAQRMKTSASDVVKKRTMDLVKDMCDRNII